MPASSSASQPVSSNSRCRGSIRRASLGDIRKKPASNSVIVSITPHEVSKRSETKFAIGSMPSSSTRQNSSRRSPPGIRHDIPTIAIGSRSNFSTAVKRFFRSWMTTAACRSLASSLPLGISRFLYYSSAIVDDCLKFFFYELLYLHQGHSFSWIKAVLSFAIYRRRLIVIRTSVLFSSLPEIVGEGLYGRVFEEVGDCDVHPQGSTYPLLHEQNLHRIAAQLEKSVSAVDGGQV